MAKVKLAIVFVLVLVVVIAALWTLRERKKTAEAEKLADQPQINAIVKNADTVGAYEKLELSLDIIALFDNPYDPDQIDIGAEFVSPSGKKWPVFGFYDLNGWKVRFSPNEPGRWTYRVKVTDTRGTVTSKVQQFDCVPSAHKGWVKISPVNKRYLMYDNGSPYHGVGVAYAWDVSAANLDKIKQFGGDLITYWNGNYDGGGSGGGKELIESAATGPGKYDQIKSRRIDELVGWLEQREMKMHFTIWTHDSLADKLKGWPQAWKRNAYSLLVDAKDFYKDEKAWEYQKKQYRYIIARWGYSRAIASWNLICEINGTDGWGIGDKAAANEWAVKINRYFHENDPYGHPTKGSMGGEEKDYWKEGYQTFDIADREIYYDLNYRTFAAEARKLWAEVQKPIFFGEAGDISDTLKYHNALWASLSNGLSMSMHWWSFNKMNDDMYRQMQAYSNFTKDIDFSRKVWTPVQPVIDKKPANQTNYDGINGSGGYVWDLDDFSNAADWKQESWASANKDKDGKMFAPAIVPGEGSGKQVAAQMLYDAGGSSQGFVRSNIERWWMLSDWNRFDSMQVDLYLKDGEFPIQAKPVIFPGGKFTEGSGQSGITLKPGQWVTLTVPIKGAVGSNWIREQKSYEMTEKDWSDIKSWPVKFTAKGDGKPVQVMISAPRLISRNADAGQTNPVNAWAMQSDAMTYGWVVSDNGPAAGVALTLKGLKEGTHRISWYDCWTGQPVAGGEDLVVHDGQTTITVPATERRDLAFKLTAK